MEYNAGNQDAAPQSRAPPAVPTAIPEQVSRNPSRIVGITIVLIIIVGAVAFLAITRNNTAPPQTTTTIISSPYPPVLASLTNSSYVLYGLPNHGAYVVSSTSSAVTNSSVYYAKTSQYGLSFASPLVYLLGYINVSTNTSIDNQLITIPQDFANYSLPITSQIGISDWRTTTAASDFFNLLTPSPSRSSITNVTITVSNVPQLGSTAKMVTVYPLFKNLESVQINVLYGSNVLVVSTIGIPNHYNSSYAVSIAQHALAALSSS